MGIVTKFNPMGALPFKAEDIAQIACSNGTTWVLKNDGTVWGCGRKDYGQQGNGEISSMN